MYLLLLLSSISTYFLGDRVVRLTVVKSEANTKSQVSLEPSKETYTKLTVTVKSVSKPSAIYYAVK